MQIINNNPKVRINNPFSIISTGVQEISLNFSVNIITYLIILLQMIDY